MILPQKSNANNGSMWLHYHNKSQKNSCLWWGCWRAYFCECCGVPLTDCTCHRNSTVTSWRGYQEGIKVMRSDKLTTEVFLIHNKVPDHSAHKTVTKVPALGYGSLPPSSCKRLFVSGRLKNLPKVQVSEIFCKHNFEVIALWRTPCWDFGAGVCRNRDGKTLLSLWRKKGHGVRGYGERSPTNLPIATWCAAHGLKAHYIWEEAIVCSQEVESGYFKTLTFAL